MSEHGVITCLAYLTALGFNVQIGNFCIYTLRGIGNFMACRLLS